MSVPERGAGMDSDCSGGSGKQQEPRVCSTGGALHIQRVHFRSLLPFAYMPIRETEISLGGGDGGLQEQSTHDSLGSSPLSPSPAPQALFGGVPGESPRPGPKGANVVQQHQVRGPGGGASVASPPQTQGVRRLF